MADPASPPKPKYRTSVNSNCLKPGDHVVSCERWEIMIDPAGLYVKESVFDDDKTSPTYGCSLIFWGTNKKPEAFNPYYTWYVDNRCSKCSEPVSDPHDCPKDKEKAHGEGQDT